MTTDVTALCARYKEALEMIAKGGEHPTELALLAYAALYNQPPVETAVEERISDLQTEVERLRAAPARHPQQDRCAYALCTEAAIHPDPRQRPCVDGCKPLIYCTEHEAFYRALLAPPAAEGGSGGSNR
jgi:hypothetical protein